MALQLAVERAVLVTISTQPHFPLRAKTTPTQNRKHADCHTDSQMKNVRHNPSPYISTHHIRLHALCNACTNKLHHLLVGKHIPYSIARQQDKLVIGCHRLLYDIRVSCRAKSNALVVSCHKLLCQVRLSCSQNKQATGCHTWHPCHVRLSCSQNKQVTGCHTY